MNWASAGQNLTHHGQSTWSRIHKTLRAWGLHTTVKGEAWHHQAQTVKGVLPGPTPDDWPTEKEDVMTPEMEERFDDLKTWVFNSTKLIIPDLYIYLWEYLNRMLSITISKY